MPLIPFHLAVIPPHLLASCATIFAHVRGSFAPFSLSLRDCRMVGGSVTSHAAGRVSNQRSGKASSGVVATALYWRTKRSDGITIVILTSRHVSIQVWLSLLMNPTVLVLLTRFSALMDPRMVSGTVRASCFSEFRMVPLIALMWTQWVGQMASLSTPTSLALT